MGILRQDDLETERRMIHAGSCGGSFLVNVVDQAEDALPITLGRQMLPAGQGGEDQGLWRRVLEEIERFSPAAGGVFLGAAEPMPGQGLTFKESPSRVDPTRMPADPRSCEAEPDLPEGASEIRIAVTANPDRFFPAD